jgi:hypothetical protein
MKTGGVEVKLHAFVILALGVKNVGSLEIRVMFDR